MLLQELLLSCFSPRREVSAIPSAADEQPAPVPAPASPSPAADTAAANGSRGQKGHANGEGLALPSSPKQEQPACTAAGNRPVAKGRTCGPTLLESYSDEGGLLTFHQSQHKGLHEMVEECNLLADLKLEHVLGSGGFATVFRGEHAAAFCGLRAFRK